MQLNLIYTVKLLLPPLSRYTTVEAKGNSKIHETFLRKFGCCLFSCFQGNFILGRGWEVDAEELESLASWLLRLEPHTVIRLTSRVSSPGEVSVEIPAQNGECEEYTCLKCNLVTGI